MSKCYLSTPDIDDMDEPEFGSDDDMELKEEFGSDDSPYDDDELVNRAAAADLERLKFARW